MQNSQASALAACMQIVINRASGFSQLAILRMETICARNGKALPELQGTRS
jgi:hypothetical protein